MRTFNRTSALIFIFSAGISLSACTTVNSVVPENLQFWSGIGSGENSPNLADTPSSDEIQKARDDVNNLRKQLEEDRDRARRIAMGVPLPHDMNEQAATDDGSKFLSLTQTQRAMWLRRNGYINGEQPSEASVIREQDLPPEYFVPQNVIVNYDNIPDAQYQPQPYSTQANDYINSSGSVITAPTQPSDLIDLQPIDGKYKLNVPETKDKPVSYNNTEQPDGLIFFEYGSSALTDADLSFLRGIADEAGNDIGPVRIVGHASAKVVAENPAAGRAKNLMMSDKRAAAVMKALVSFGIDKDRIEVSAYGDSIPMFEIPNMDAEAAARRVEIYFGEARPATAMQATAPYADTYVSDLQPM